jgi:hypothetical protein
MLPALFIFVRSDYFYTFSALTGISVITLEQFTGWRDKGIAMGLELESLKKKVITI